MLPSAWSHGPVRFLSGHACFSAVRQQRSCRHEEHARGPRARTVDGTDSGGPMPLPRGSRAEHLEFHSRRDLTCVPLSCSPLPPSSWRPQSACPLSSRAAHSRRAASTRTVQTSRLSTRSHGVSACPLLLGTRRDGPGRARGKLARRRFRFSTDGTTADRPTPTSIYGCAGSRPLAAARDLDSTTTAWPTTCCLRRRAVSSRGRSLRSIRCCITRMSSCARPTSTRRSRPHSAPRARTRSSSASVPALTCARCG